MDINLPHNQPSARPKAGAKKTLKIIAKILAQHYRTSYLCINKDVIAAAPVWGFVLELPKFVPWHEYDCANLPDVRFVLLPSAHPGSTHSLQAVPVEPGSRELKQPIERPAGYEGFIHEGKWIAGGSRDQLLELASNQ